RFFQPPQQFLDLEATVYRLLISLLKTVNYQARILHQLALRQPRHRLSKGMLQKALNFLKN
ncbi:MAG: Pex protein, partial [Cyanobacteriota bacterium]|nr:Pex protein [Cyanobacteriota bacterium]